MRSFSDYNTCIQLHDCTFQEMTYILTIFAIEKVITELHLSSYTLPQNQICLSISGELLLSSLSYFFLLVQYLTCHSH